MPSPTSSTCPTSRVSPRLSPVRVISCSMTEAISAALNLMAAPLFHLFPDGLQAGADAGVVDPVLDAHHQPAQQLRVDPGLQDGLAPEGLAQLLAQAVLLVVAQGHRRAHVHAHPPAALVEQLA